MPYVCRPVSVHVCIHTHTCRASAVYYMTTLTAGPLLRPLVRIVCGGASARPCLSDLHVRVFGYVP